MCIYIYIYGVHILDLSFSLCVFINFVQCAYDVIDRIMTLLRNSDLHVHVFSSLLGKGVSVLTNRVREELMAFFYNLYLLGGYAASEKKI